VKCDEPTAAIITTLTRIVKGFIKELCKKIALAKNERPFNRPRLIDSAKYVGLDDLKETVSIVVSNIPLKPGRHRCSMLPSLEVLNVIPGLIRTETAFSKMLRRSG
jgi:hypothetical protein